MWRWKWETVGRNAWLRDEEKSWDGLVSKSVSQSVRYWPLDNWYTSHSIYSGKLIYIYIYIDTREGLIVYLSYIENLIIRTDLHKGEEDLYQKADKLSYQVRPQQSMRQSRALAIHVVTRALVLTNRASGVDLAHLGGWICMDFCCTRLNLEVWRIVISPNLSFLSSLGYIALLVWHFTYSQVSNLRFRSKPQWKKYQ